MQTGRCVPHSNRMVDAQTPWAVLWDVDGVLVDSNAAHFAAFRALGDQAGTPVTTHQLQATFGLHNRAIMPMLFGAHLTEAEITRLSLLKEDLYRQRARTELSAIPGAVALVHAVASAGGLQAVGSSGPRLNVDLALSLMDLRRFMGAVITGDDVAAAKPAPDIFLAGARALGIPPGRCVVVEDAPAGVAAARAAGMAVLAVTTSTTADRLSAATRVVSSPLSVTATDLRDMALHRGVEAVS